MQKEMNIFKRGLFLKSFIFVRNDHNADQIQNVFMDIDSNFNKKSVIKNDKYVVAGILALPEGRKVFIKKYLKRGFFYSLWHIAKKNRCLNNFEFYHQSLFLINQYFVFNP